MSPQRNLRALRASFSNESFRARLLEETKVQVAIAGPVMLGYLLQLSLNMVAIFVVGHTGGAHELAAISLGNMFVIITGLSVAFGLATALDTLSSQEYGRDPTSKMLGVYLQRGVVISMVAAIPIALLWIAAEPILVACKQDPEVARLAGLLVRILIPALPFVLVFECMKKYLSAMGKTMPIFFAMLAAFAINILLSYLFVVVAGWGFAGASSALAISWVVEPLALLAYFLYSGIHKVTWGGWSREALRGWTEYLKLGLPGMAMICSEWWALEILALAAGVMGEAELATHSIVATTASLAYMIPYSVGVAATTRVGNHLGAGLKQRAHMAMGVSIFLGICIAAVVATLLLTLRNHWASLFTDDASVQPLVAAVLAIYGGFHIMDGMQAILSGVVRGLGKQKWGALSSFIAMYIVGVPMALVFAFPLNMGLPGLWWGLALALSCSATFYAIICWKVEWRSTLPTGSSFGLLSEDGDNDEEIQLTDRSMSTVLHDHDVFEISESDDNLLDEELKF